MSHTSPTDRFDPTAHGGDRSGSDARNQLTSAPYRIGVLSPHNSTETKAILNAIRALGHEPVWLRDENVEWVIRNGQVRISPAVDVVINRLLVTKSETVFEDLQLAGLYAETVPVINEPTAVAAAVHKFRASVRLAAADLPIPDALYGRSIHTIAEWADKLPFQIAHKRTVGTNGQFMSLVSPDEPVNPTIGNEPAFLQEFLDDEADRPSDVRVYVVDGTIVGAMRRQAPPNDWRTNVARGGTCVDVTDHIDHSVAQLARRAIDVFDLDIGGVDLISLDGDWYVLEVNATAGFKGLYSATNRSPAPAIAKLAIERIGGTIDQSRVDTLSQTLDDSVPECKPQPDQSVPERSVLGFTNEVSIRGKSGIETVIAKTDTGAERTSIDTELAGTLGVGPIDGSTHVRSAIDNGVEVRPIAPIDLAINGRWQTVHASLTDRRKMKYPVLLGRDVLGDFTIDISQRAEE